MADLVIAASGVATANTGTQTAWGICAVAITAGQTVYADSTTSYQLRLGTAASGSGAASNSIVGIALNSTAGAGQPVQYAYAGDLTLTGTTAGVGQVYMASTNAGAIAPSADYNAATTLTLYGCIIGIATTATNLRLAIKSSGVLRV